MLEIKDLKKSFGDKKVLKGINLSIEKGEIVGIIGPSGCGKSTLLRCINFLETPTSGKIIFENELIDNDKEITFLRRKVGMVFQQPNPFPMSIYDNVAYGPRVHGIKDKKKLDKIVEDSLRGAAIWEEVKERRERKGSGTKGLVIMSWQEGTGTARYTKEKRTMKYS